ncbi:MAG: O-antigen ligase family protein [Bryobacteraceae bacterium]|nr:O-antigen ligase family protein [Bryobacteraceae bacterium]
MPVGFAAAYVVGSEVLWRMTGASVFWEGGKYAIAAGLAVYLARHARMVIPPAAAAYLLLLLPSALLTVQALGLDRVRSPFSFYLSGPVALAVSLTFFSSVRLAPVELWKVVFGAIGPVFAIFAIAARGAMAASYGSESNMEASGGFGPNQVSAVLGMGASILLLTAITARPAAATRLLLMAGAVALSAQSALTLSRGGLYASGGATLAAAFFLVRRPGVRTPLVLTIAVTALIGFYVVLPRLDDFTGGALANRFRDTGLTGRDELIEEDLRMWQENPVLGVGVGMSKYGHRRGLAAHTEFSRLVAEHGTLGLAALCFLLSFGISRVLGASSTLNAAVCAAALTWSLMFMTSNAMRLSAASFIFGIAAWRQPGALEPVLQYFRVTQPQAQLALREVD